MQICKTDIIPNKIKNDGSDFYVNINTFLAMNHITNVIALTFPRTKKSFQASIAFFSM